VNLWETKRKKHITVFVVTFPLELDDISDAMIDDNKYRTDILDSRMDSIRGGAVE